MEADAARFDRLVDAQMEDITARLKSYETVLYGGVGHLNGSDEVSAEEWRRYVLSIPFKETAPGILGIGTIVPVNAEDREAKMEEFERTRGEAFEYKTVGGVEPPADLSYVIDRIEPIERNRTALGLDIGSEQNRREAYEKARDSGEPQVTGIISLVQDDEKTPGFLLIIPRYRMDMKLETVADRRAAFIDAVYAPMIGEDILSLPAKSEEIAFQVYDEKKQPERLIHSVLKGDWEKTSINQVVEWTYAGRTWLIHSWATPKFVSKLESREQTSFLYFGITLSTLLAVILFALHRSHGRAVRLMEKYHQEADEKTRINELFVEHAPAAIAIFDAQLRFLAASRRWMEQFGLRGDLPGRHYYDVFPEIHDMAEWKDAHQKGLAGESISGGDDCFQRKDGTVQYLRWEIHPWRKSDGSIGGIIAFSLDVTQEVEDRRCLQEAQREMAIVEERLSQATAAGNVGIWDWRIESNQLTWNEQMFELFGVRRNEFSGEIGDFHRATHPDDLPRAREALRNSIDQGVDYEIEYRTARQDHPTVQAVGQVHRDEQGKPVRMLGVCVDVSEQVRMRSELKQAMESHATARHEAENMVKAREQFLATMSHELRTPMNGMIGMSELLLATQLDERQREYARTIADCGKTLMELVNDILDLTRIRAGAVEIEQITYDPAALLSRVVAMCSLQARQKGLELMESVDAAVPREVNGDSKRVQQVLLNLVSNALKFTEAGRVNCSLALAKDLHGRELLVFRIEDSGVGMSGEELEKVLQPFVQADASITRKHGGSGLGLSISRSLALLMGGSLEIESEPGNGTIATVKIPLSLPQDELPAGGAAEAGTGDGEGEPGLAIRKLLIVEDNPVNQRVTELQMKAHAGEIEIAEDGRQAVERYKEGDFDFILMDCQMPVMDGFEAARRIRAHEEDQGLPPVTIVALTANVQDVDRERARKAGMNGFLGKPLQLEVLVEELKRLGKR